MEMDMELLKEIVDEQSAIIATITSVTNTLHSMTNIITELKARIDALEKERENANAHCE